MMTLTLIEQLEATQKLWERGVTKGYHRGLLEGLQSALDAHDRLTTTEFARWKQAARDVIAIQEETEE